MDDDSLSNIPEVSGIERVENDDLEAQAAANAREKEFEELLKADDFLLNDDDEDSDSSDEEMHSSDDDLASSHHTSGISEKEPVDEEERSQDFAQQSSVQESHEHSIQLNEPNPFSSLINPGFSQLEQHSRLTESDVSHDSDVDHSNMPDGNQNELHSNCSDVNESNILDVNYSHVSKDQSVVNVDDFHSSNFSNENPINSSSLSQSQISKASQLDIQINDRRTETVLDLENVSVHDSIAKKYNQQRRLKTDVKHSNELLSTYPEIHKPENISRSPLDHTQSELYQEYLKLQLLYATRGKELELIKKEQISVTQFYEEELKNLQLYKTHAEREKDRLNSSLQELQMMISDSQHENNVLKGKLAAVELQLSAEKEAKEAAEAKLESNEITIQSLQQKVSGLLKSENAVRFQQQNESIVKELKLRHQKDTLELKEEIDKLRRDLNSKIMESENLTSKVTQWQEKYEKLQMEKCEIFNKLSTQLNNSQRDYQKLLESGAVSEAAKMKLQNEHLQEVNSKLEKENMILKGKIESLKEELEISEAVRSMPEKESDIQKSNRDQSQSDSDLKTKLKKYFKNMESLRKQNDVLKEKLDENEKVPFLEEKAKLFESRYKESELKVKELQRKLEEVLPEGSIPVLKHNEKMNILQNDLAGLKKKLQDVSRSLQVSSSNEMKLQEENKYLKNTIAEMTETHAAEKIQAIENCRDKYLELHENAIKKLEEKYTSENDKNLKMVCAKYKNEINQLKNENELLLKDRDEARTQYVRLFEENESLMAKIGSISKPKEREEIEREVRCEYDKKLNEKVKELFQKYKSFCDSQLENEKEEWAKQKMEEVKEFVNATKQQLDEEFVKYKEKEHYYFEVKLKEEKEKIVLEYERKINDLKQQFAEEKKYFIGNSEISEMQQKHQNQIAAISQKFQSTVKALESELKVLKDKNDDTVLKADRKIQLEFQEQINDLKQQHEKEKESLVSELRESFQTKWKDAKVELQKSHQNEINSIRQKYDENISALENEIRSLKESELFKKSHIEEIQMLKEEKQAWEKDRSDFIKTEKVLNEKLSIAYDLEKEYKQKIRKYSKAFSSMKKTHQEKSNQLQKKINQLQSMNEELKKSISEKENELMKVNEKFDQNIHQFEEYSQKRHSIKVSSCQTEEEVVPRSTLQRFQDMFIECLKKIQVDIKNFLLETRKRSAEQLQRALNYYHDQLVSKIFQNVLKDASSFGQPYVLRMNKNFHSSASSSDNRVSPNPVQHPFSSDLRISNSTPIDRLASGDLHKRSDMPTNCVNNVKVLQNERTAPDSAMRFEDISYDFIPLKIHDFAYTSTKLPEYAMPSGLFNHKHIFNSYPDRDSPLSFNK